MFGKTFVAVFAALGAVAASAAPFSLSNYRVAGNFALDRHDSQNGMGLEASAVTYARDRGTLFVAGDEGFGIVEITRTGQTVSTMSIAGPTNGGWPVASGNHDAEGLTYIGGGVLVVAEERLQDAIRFSYVGGGTVSLTNAPFASIGGNAGNNGTEGISYDLRDGSFVSVKQQSPQEVRAGALTFAVGGGTSTMAPLFNPAVLSLATLSDVQTLSPVDALAGTPQADHLLILSLGSNLLVEATRGGVILSSFDLSGIVPNNAIEGVTIDERGVIYLVAEHEQDPETVLSRSRLIVLAPVPAPGTLALMLAGFGVLGWRARRRG